MTEEISRIFKCMDCEEVVKEQDVVVMAELTGEDECGWVKQCPCCTSSDLKWVGNG